MTTLLAIDPGNDTGWAKLFGGLLVACGVGEPPMEDFDRVIVERPQIYQARLMKGNPNDLITLAIGVGRYVERYTKLSLDVELVMPATWKGQVPKEIHHERILKALSEEERAYLDTDLRGVAKSKRHNAMDAVGLGKWAVR